MAHKDLVLSKLILPEYRRDFTNAFELAGDFLGDKSARRFTDAGQVVRVDEDTIALVLHRTPVVTYHRDRTFTCYGGGWNTLTTRNYIDWYSPSRPSAAKDYWSLYDSGERTPERIQKCRTCKGTGETTWVDHCRPLDPCSRGAAASGRFGKANYVAEKPCEHGYIERHFQQPCTHGLWSPHSPQQKNLCTRCKGGGRTDYGSKVIYVQTDAHTAYRVGLDGKIIDFPITPRQPRAMLPPTERTRDNRW